MKRLHLMHQRYPDVWYLIDINDDYFGAAHQGLISITNTEDVIQADSFQELLLKLREDESDMFWVVTDWYGSDGKFRHDEYPEHQSIHRIKGYIKEVCGFQYDESPGIRDWEIHFLSELWIRKNDSLSKVHDFTEKITKEVIRFAEKENNYCS